MTSHLWLHGAHRADCVAALDTLTTLPPALVPVTSAHRGLRGPFTAAGSVLRALVPDALLSSPDLVDRHQIELLSVAPELRQLIHASRETLTSLAVPKERTRYYSGARTLRLAHGIVEFLGALLGEPTGEPRSLSLLDVDSADPTDAEFVAVLLRRLDPAVLTVVVCTGTRPLPDVLARALATFAEPISAPGVAVPDTTADDVAAAHRYVAADCVDDEPPAAYLALPAAERAALHDRRADELADRDEFSLGLGAIPYHRERGGDPAGAGAQTLAVASDYCAEMGFYHAALDLGTRGRALLDWSAEEKLWWLCTTRMFMALTCLDRPEDAEDVFLEATAWSTRGSVHMQAAYGMSMIYTRYRSNRDHIVAKSRINQAIAFARNIFEGKERAFHMGFHQNGLALVEMHLGHIDEALRLVETAMNRLDTELEPHEHRLHRSVLRHNRATLLAKLGRLDEALAGFDEVIEIDPNYPDYHLDRGNVLHRMGRDDEALAAFDTAVRLGPPFPEAQYNRAEILLCQGEREAARAVLDYVLVLDPDMVDAYVNLAGIHLAADEVDAANADAVAGLERDRDNPHLLAVLGQVHALRDEHELARDAFDRALAADPDMVCALSGRAVLLHESGDDPAALADLDHAITLEPRDATLQFNRAYLRRRLEQWDAALADLESAATLDPTDDDIAAALAEIRERLVRPTP